MVPKPLPRFSKVRSTSSSAASICRSWEGLEFLKSVGGAAKGVPVIMITTEGSEGRVVEVLSAGARGYLRKPFTPEQVKERVTPLLANAV